jgi:phage terminase large subunit-like protein
VNALDRYATAITAGRLPAGKYHVAACARHLRDRAREGRRGFPYRFELARAERFFRFAAALRHYKGQWAGQLIQLQPYQQFRLGSIFAWTSTRTGLRRFRTAYNELPRKNGKALAIDTPVPTPRGWTAHGDLRVGDTVFGPDGRPIRVEWVGPVQTGPCYRLTLSTGETFIAHAAHEWVTSRTWYTGRRKGSRAPLPPVETQQIATTLRQSGARGDYVHRIAVADGLQLPTAPVTIPPYILGAWLGDGTSRSGSITVADVEIVTRMRAEGRSVHAVSRHGAATLYRIGGHQGAQWSFTSQLRRLGVLGRKHIPPQYLRASYAQRLELLRGIVDTDGYLGPKGVYEVVTVSARLADDYRELIQSLGLKCTRTEDRARLHGKDCGPRYRLNFSAHHDQVATVPRKQTTWQPTTRRRSRARTIIACDPCEPVPVNCIQVEGGVYLAGRAMVPTHNSLEAAVVALYVSFFDNEPGAEGYVIATKREQARIVFNDCKRLVQSSGLRSRIAVLTANLHRDDTASKLEPLGADRDSTDGLNPQIVTIDEAHAMKHRGLIDVMETATGARRQPLIHWITTAGSDPFSPCGDQHDYACKVLDGIVTDETLFAFIAHADVDDDPWAEATWRKANPNYGVSVLPADLHALAHKARNMPPAANAFKQKRLNLWIQALTPWLSLDGWRRGQTAWTLDDQRGAPCYIGIDMSSKIDLTAVALVFPPTADRASWRIVPWCLTPEDTLDDRAHRDRAPYRQWLALTKIGATLRTNPGNRIDQDLVRDLVREAAARFDVQAVGLDPWNAGNLVQHLVDDGYLVTEVPQNLSQMSAPAKDFEADVLDGLVDACGDPLMQWCVSNVVVQRDNKDNIYPTKRRSRGRIDPVIAALIARKLATMGTIVADDPQLVVA